MSLPDKLLNKVVREDYANHYMRGSWAGMVGSSLTFVFLALTVRPSVAVSLWVAAFVGQACAYGIGRWKEKRDAKANVKAMLDDKPPVHEVAHADWQWTTWGAAPLSITLLIAAIASMFGGP